MAFENVLNSKLDLLKRPNRRTAYSTDKETTKQRLLARAKITETDCWEWIGGRSRRGYGRIVVFGKLQGVSRVAAWVWKDFDLNSDLLICHKCDNPPCFNPKHLFVGTNKDNTQDCIAKGRGTFTWINAKLSIENVKKIRKLYATGNYTYQKLGNMFGVDVGTVGAIWRRETWNS